MGWKQYCPRCKETRETTCCACGCGNCLTCDYRFSCMSPIPFVDSSVKIEPIKIWKVKSLKFKKLDPNATPPKKAKEKDAGYDLHALNDCTIPSLPRAVIKYLCGLFYIEDTVTSKIPTGIALEIPENHVGLICDRSGLGSKSIKTFGGVIDETYRGDVTVCLMNFSFFDYEIKSGDRIAQILILPVASPKLEEVEELSSSERGTAGFGSSGIGRNIKEFHE